MPADAVWMMHLDMDAARESTVLRRMHDRAMAMHPQLEAMIATVKGMTGMDPRQDLHDVTAYGRDTDKRKAVMVVRAKANREFLEKMVEKARDHRTMEHGGRTLHSWTHRGRWDGDADAMRLLSGLRTQTDGETCTIAWDASADDVWKAVDEAVTAWEKKHRRKGGGSGCPACGQDGCEGCGACPFRQDAEAGKQARPQTEEF